MNVIIGAIIGAILGGGSFFLFGGRLTTGNEFAQMISAVQIVKLVVTIGICAVLGGMAGSMILIVRQKTALVIELLGKFQTVKHAGLNFKLPSPFAVVAGEVNLQINLLTENVGVKSNDNAFLHVPVKLHYQVIEEKANLAHYELKDPKQQIISYIVNMLRASANGMSMDEIFSSKEEFKTSLAGSLSDKMAQYGYRIVDVLVDDPQPSEKLRESFDNVLAAKRDQDASELEKVAIMNRIVGKAEAEAQSLELKATAYVKGRKILAKGNSEAIKEFCEGLDGVDHEFALQYFAGLDMRDAIRDAAASGSAVVIPADMTGSGLSQTVSMMKAMEKIREKESKGEKE